MVIIKKNFFIKIWKDISPGEEDGESMQRLKPPYRVSEVSLLIELLFVFIFIVFVFFMREFYISLTN